MIFWIDRLYHPSQKKRGLSGRYSPTRHLRNCWKGSYLSHRLFSFQWKHNFRSKKSLYSFQPYKIKNDFLQNSNWLYLQLKLLYYLVPKKSYQKNNFAEYRKLLSGKLEYQSPIKTPNSFKGFLKLKNDPKVEQLSDENFIPRGAILTRSEW